MRICLSMIVKNEASCIERCLASVLPHIDSAVIVDTGSSDDTMGRIARVFREAKLENMLVSRPWEDFATNRNEALNIVRDEMLADYILFMDASDVFEGTLPSSALFLGLDAYRITHTLGNQAWKRPALVRNDLPWHWVGKVHEVLEYAAGPYTSVDLEGCKIRCNVGQPFQGVERFLRDAKLLEGETDPRSVFYRAQSWACAGEDARALEDYLTRAGMVGGFWQEQYVSKVRAHLLGGPLYLVEDASRLDPSRAEAWYYRGLHSLKHGQITQGRILLERAKDLPLPPHALFADTDIYTFKALACWALLTKDKEAARKVVNTPGAEYPSELWELAHL